MAQKRPVSEKTAIERQFEELLQYRNADKEISQIRQALAEMRLVSDSQVVIYSSYPACNSDDSIGSLE